MALLKRKGPDDLRMAEKNFQKQLALDPETQSAQTPLGTIRLETGDYEGALYYYSEALGMNPLDAAARINRAIAYERTGRYNEALSDYRFFLTMPGRDRVPEFLAYARERIQNLSYR
jgi:tetratricopeptide (TPR) repeat protein